MNLILKFRDKLLVTQIIFRIFKSTKYNLINKLFLIFKYNIRF
jgi:hypothetical protein